MLLSPVQQQEQGSLTVFLKGDHEGRPPEGGMGRRWAPCTRRGRRLAASSQLIGAGGDSRLRPVHDHRSVRCRIALMAPYEHATCAEGLFPTGGARTPL